MTYRPRFAVGVILPSGSVAIGKRFGRHRDAWNWILDHENELGMRFGIRMYVRGLG